MASAPYPSPFPYASSSYSSPPAPGFFPAPAHGPSTFIPLPPAPPPAYPYPPSASAYTAAAGFSAVPAYGPSTLPSTIHLPYSQVHAPSPESTPPSAQPWVASSPSPGLDHVLVFQPLAAETATTAPVRRPDRVPSTPIPCGRSTTPPRLLDTVRTPLNRERIPLQNNLAMEQYANEGPHTPEKPRALCTGEMAAGKSGNVLHPATPDFMFQGGDLANGNGAGCESIFDETFVRKHTGPGSLSIAQRLPRRPDHSFVTLQATTAPTPIFSFASSSASSKTGATASSSASSLNSYFGESCAAPTPACDSVSVTRPSAVPSTMAYVAPQLFGEMPAQNSGQETHSATPNHYPVHGKSIQTSCVQSVSTSSGWHNPDGMPQSYGFHNLHRQSVFLADGTEHSYFTLPADYPSEHAPQPMSPSVVEHVRVTAPLSVACLAPGICSKANNTAGYDSLPVHGMQLPTVLQDAPNGFKEMPVYDVCEDDAMAYRNCVHPKVGISVLDNEPIVLCVNKESANVFREGATVFPSIHVPYLFVGGSIECSHKNNKIDLPSFSNSDLCCEHGKGQVHNHQWNMLLTERRDEWDPGIRKTIMDIPLVVKWSSLILWNMLLTERRDEWDPGASVFLVSPLKVDTDKPMISPERPTDGVFSFTNKNKSENELLVVCFSNASDNVFSEEATCFPFAHGPVTHTERSIMLTNKHSTQVVSILTVQEETVHCNDEKFEINSKKQDALINKHSIIYPFDLNTDKEVPFPLQYNLPLSSAPCIWDPGINLFSYKKLHIFPWIPSSAIIILQQVHNKNISSLLEFSLEKGRHVQWDPGIKLLLCELLWLQTMTKETEYALRHLLALKIGTHDSTYSMDTTTTICSPTNLIQQGRNFAAVLHFCLSIFNDMHCCQSFQKCNSTSSQLLWNKNIKCYGVALWLIHFQPP